MREFVQVLVALAQSIIEYYVSVKELNAIESEAELPVTVFRQFCMLHCIQNSSTAFRLFLQLFT